MADRAAPLVVACLAPTDLRPAVDPTTGAVSIDLRRADLSASDAAALELALQAGETWGVGVAAVTAGPPELDALLRSAAALGASPYRVPWASEELAGAPASVAQALAGAIHTLGRPILTLCGDRSALRGSGAVPAYLAEHLGAAQALGLVSLSFDQSPAAVLAERRLDGGWREKLRVPTPAVCSVEAAGVRLRRAALVGSLTALVLTVPVIGPECVQPSTTVIRPSGPRPYRPRAKTVPAPTGSTRDRLLALTGALSTRQPPRVVGPMDGGRAASELLDFLKQNGYR